MLLFVAEGKFLVIRLSSLEVHHYFWGDAGVQTEKLKRVTQDFKIPFLLHSSFSCPWLSELTELSGK